MPYVIMFDDATPRDLEKKKRIRPIHIEYVIANAHRIAASGGFFPEDDDFPDGGLIILDVETRAEAVAYVENDPFHKNGIFTKYTIRRFRKAIFDGKRITI